MNFTQLQEELKEGKVLVDFYAKWCGPCKMMLPTIDALAAEGHKIVKIDVEEVPEVQDAYDVFSVPTFLVFENGKSTKRVTGFVPKELLEDMLVL